MLSSEVAIFFLIYSIGPHFLFLELYSFKSLIIFVMKNNANTMINDIYFLTF